MAIVFILNELSRIIENEVISIIIVNYHVKKELFECLESINTSKAKIPYEIIVVDNDEHKTLYVELHKKFPKVIYIRNENKGFGQGCNVGAKSALGEYLFFLNPDTLLKNNCIDVLSSYLKNHKQVGIVAPVLFDAENKAFVAQGLEFLTPVKGIVALSFINTFFPNNRISRNYWNLDWNKKSPKNVGQVPGTAFMIRQDVFEKIQGFDERFFLFFEENDLCKRVSDNGFAIVMHPEAGIYHAWGRSTEKSTKNMNKIFAQSRFYYFRKHFGLFWAVIVELFTRSSKKNALLFLLLFSALILRLYHLQIFMPFIGDQAWFYLSARDMLLTGHIPLVGITSSHTWLHQGPLWTYILGLFLLIGHFHPVAPAIFTAILDALGVYLIYRVGTAMFSKRLGLIAGALYAFSPEIIGNAQMPYHTSLIPIVTTLFIYCLYKWISGTRLFFPLVIFFLAALYNLELATFVFLYVLLGILIYGYIRKENWIKGLVEKKIIWYSIVAFFVPMLPMFLYDVSHNYPQTLGFLKWNLYKILTFFGLPRFHETVVSNWGDMFAFAFNSYRELIFPSSWLVACIILFVSALYIFFKLMQRASDKKSIVLLILINTVSIGGLFASRTTSGAYVPMLFPGVILFTSYFFDSVMERKIFVTCTLIALGLILIFNSYFVISSHSVTRASVQGLYYPSVEKIAEIIVRESGGKEYNLYVNSTTTFPSLSMNYEYVAWWLGHSPSKLKQPLSFVISETSSGTYIKVVSK